MAHDPFRGAKRPPPEPYGEQFESSALQFRLVEVVDAAETAQDAPSAPPSPPTPDPPGVAPGAQEGPVSLDTPLTDAATAEFKSALEREMAALNDAEAQAPGYPCRLSSCGQVLASPGALGGHMAAHRKRGELG